MKLHWLSVGKERYIEVDDDISFKLVSVDINKANVFSVRGPENSSNLFCTLSRELVVCQIYWNIIIMLFQVRVRSN